MHEGSYKRRGGHKDKSRLELFWQKKRDLFRQEHATFSKEAVIRATMTCGCQTWSLTKIIGNKLKVAQRAMERKILGIKIKDKIPCKNIRQQTHTKDVVLFAERQKWDWAGHVARMADNRWTKRAMVWQPRIGKRSRGKGETMAERGC
ncbi:endonuclease-reverse transcriptase [Elysia marginata]|uniref:Endonuclease-reverse transcriptase n=1 Tax=Elysia marginata TaxID=1093978 RepID=A0AAV4ESW6_9GAST|nr:endonuclease-reverse transcriptase [Elysia marginata]